ncbi:MAG: hypothetical protein GX558_09615 [Clostridiales bacterium]|nr:hypothetical protein [Clostridiales bacterium]
MNKFRSALCGVLALILTLALAGCMNTRQEAATQPPAMTTPMPGTAAPLVSPPASMEPGGTSGAMTPGATGAAPANPFDWGRNAASVEGNINKISEIASSAIVVNGTTALVGVTFASQYKGQMTDRIRNMVAGQVMAADPAITTVAVTAEPSDVAKINDIAGKIRNGSPPDQFTQEIDAIVRNVTTST